MLNGPLKTGLTVLYMYYLLREGQARQLPFAMRASTLTQTPSGDPSGVSAHLHCSNITRRGVLLPLDTTANTAAYDTVKSSASLWELVKLHDTAAQSGELVLLHMTRYPLAPLSGRPLMFFFKNVTEARFHVPQRTAGICECFLWLLHTCKQYIINLLEFAEHVVPCWQLTHRIEYTADYTHSSIVHNIISDKIRMKSQSPIYTFCKYNLHPRLPRAYAWMATWHIHTVEILLVSRYVCKRVQSQNATQM